MNEFVGMQKIARLSKDCVITEKIDGTNAQIYIGADGTFLVGKRTAWIIKQNDNHGFAAWAYEHKDELMTLGPGRYFGEWWGKGIQRGYGLNEKRFSLFRPTENLPACVSRVPVLFEGPFDTDIVQRTLEDLKRHGSYAAPGFMEPEGIVIYHKAANICFKKTFDDNHKGS